MLGLKCMHMPATNNEMCLVEGKASITTPTIAFEHIGDRIKRSHLNVMAGPTRKWLFMWEPDHQRVNTQAALKIEIKHLSDAVSAFKRALFTFNNSALYLLRS